MRIAITGARGRMGRVLASKLAQKHILFLFDIDNGCDMTSISSLDAVIHLAINFSNAAASLIMLEDALRTADPSCFIYASSLTVDPHAAVEGEESYVAAKISGEARCAEWVSTRAARAVALRFGHFNPGSTPPHQHEAVRLTEAGLLYWVERALSEEPPIGTLTVWSAAGNGGFLSGGIGREIKFYIRTIFSDWVRIAGRISRTCDS